MAICTWCGREMTTARSCAVGVLHRAGRPFPLSPYGSEPGWSVRPGERCGDCGVLPGGFHHPGCDIARCPACEGQMLMCGCRFDEDGPDDDGDDDGFDDDLDLSFDDDALADDALAAALEVLARWDAQEHG